MTISSGPANEDAVKKFGNAKAISSDQYFGNGNEMSVRVFSTAFLNLSYQLFFKSCEINK